MPNLFDTAENNHMMVNIPKQVLVEILGEAISMPADFFDCISELKEFPDFVKHIRDTYECALCDKDGSLVFQAWNTDLSTNKGGYIDSEFEMDFDSIVFKYMNWAEWPVENMKNHAKQLRQFADKIDKLCDSKED